MPELNSILLKILEIFILMTSVLLVVTRFTVEAEPDDEEEQNAVVVILFGMVMAAASAMAAGSYLLIRVLFKVKIIDKIGTIIVFGLLLFALFCLLLDPVAILKDYGNQFGNPLDDE